MPCLFPELSYIQWIDYIVKHYGRDELSFLPNKRRITSSGYIRVSNNSIGSHGELFKCHRDFGDDSKITGDIWKGRYYNDTESEYCSVINPLSKCFLCSYLPVCMRGCANHRILGYDGFDCEAFIRMKWKLKLLEGGVYK